MSATELYTPVEIPDPDRVRIRLAAVLTEASVLRALLRVSARAARERERLRRLVAAEQSDPAAVARSHAEEVRSDE